ncbi:zinc finger CCCH domain-containing protein 10-like [Lycorma delicatula]|uniref:zinc finger CCCH domain-containing protein 10-like n=1 Tax=Lycorma delicatula TaxID=130591 RepID=UPI003F517847
MGSGSECNDYDERRDIKRRRTDRRSSDYDNRKRDERRHERRHERDMVCRDFLRNICNRGSACKFQHPESQKRMFHFCHDFQNGVCRRSKHCKFIHSSPEDELYYRKTGELPPHLTDVNDKRPRSRSPEENGSPLCKLYLWGECWDENCRYRHVTASEYRRIEGRSPSPLMKVEENIFKRRSAYDCNDKKSKYVEDYYEPELKRSFLEENDPVDNVVDNNVNRFENGGHYSNRLQPERTYMMLEEENMILRERVSELKKKVYDLQVTNEFLLEQNAQLRLREKNAAGLTTMTVPAVTITNSVPGANQMQQAPTAQQMVNAALRTVTASVATVPVSLAAVTPVSIAAVSMAPVQQMPPPVVTMAQQGAPPSDTQIPPPPLPPLPLSISAPSAPLVSYPIMSRTVMQMSRTVLQPPPPDMSH